MSADRQKTTPATLSEEGIGIDLVELETFMAVARLGSFSDAAKQMHVTQPSVTGRVQRLEASLGTPLLIRTTRSVEPTPEGAALLLEASRTLDGLRTLVSGFRHKARAARQRVVVAATPTIAALMLPPVIRDYSQRYTDVQVVLRDLRHAEALSALDDGTADLAVLAYEGPSTRYRVQALYSHEVVVVAPPNHPLAKCESVTVAQLAPHPLLLVEQYQPMLERVAAVARLNGLSLADPISVDNMNTLLGMLHAGLAPALLPREIVERRRFAEHAVLEIIDLKLSRDIALLRTSKSRLGTAAESFARFVREKMH